MRSTERAEREGGRGARPRGEEGEEGSGALKKKGHRTAMLDGTVRVAARHQSTSIRDKVAELKGVFDFVRASFLRQN